MERIRIAGASSLLIGALLFGTMPSSVNGQDAAPSDTALHVHAGYGGANVTVEEFFPSTIRISEGTTVTWTLGSLREHTVTFLAGGPRLQPDISQPEDSELPHMKNPKV